MKSSFAGWLPVLILFITFCTGLQVTAQETSKNPTLKETLSKLEKRYELRFSYREQDIEGITTPPPDENLSLEEILKFLEKQTSMTLRRIDERYIAVIKILPKIDIVATVLDITTGNPLEGATLYTSDSLNTGITDRQGRFALKNVPKDAIIHVRFLGYEAYQRSAADILTEERIYLTPEFQPLQETVVVNYLTSGISKKIDGSTYINTDRFGALPGMIEPDVLQTIESLPGVESVNETVSNINIRGGTSDQNLVLFDGIKMYLTGHFFGLISAFNPNLTKEVKVIKNGSSSQFNDGTSGTIQIHSKDELSKTFSAGAGVTLVSADAFFQVPVTEKLELHFSGRRSINDIINTPTYNNYFSRTLQGSEISMETSENYLKTADFNYFDTSIKALYDLSSDHQFRFTFINIKNALEYKEVSKQDSSEELRRSGLAQNNLALGGTWRAKWNESFETTTSSYLTRYRLDAQNYTLNTDQRLLQENEVLESGLKFNTITALSKNLDLLSGYQFYEVGVSNNEKLNNPFFSSTIKNVIRSHAVYSEIEFLGEQTFLRGGLRLNYLPKFDTFLVEPRLSFNQSLGASISFKVLAEAKSQTTSQIIDLQGDFLGVENRRWILSDDDTHPLITSRQVSVGFDFKANGWYIDLEAFLKEVNGISTLNQGFQDQNEFRRTSGSYTARGMELLINKKSGPFHTYLTYSLGENHYTFEELSPSTFPNNFDIRHSGSLAANYTIKKLKFSLGGHLRSGKPYTRPVPEKETRREGNNWVVNHDSPNAETLPSYFRVDFSSSYSFNFTEKTDASLSLGLLNILNRENIINRYYRVSNDSPHETLEIDNTSLGFTPNILFKITF